MPQFLNITFLPSRAYAARCAVQFFLIFSSIIYTSASLSQSPNWFEYLDIDGDGVILIDELPARAVTLKAKFDDIDTDNSQSIDEAELQAAFEYRKKNRSHADKLNRAQQKAELRKLWEGLDDDQNGVITLNELPNSYRIVAIEEILDTNADRRISADEYITALDSAAVNLDRALVNMRQVVARRQVELQQRANLPEINLDQAITSSDQVTDFLQQFANALQLDGLVAVAYKDGKQFYQYTFGDYDLNTSLLMGSASKWVSSIVIMRLVDQGVLDLDAPLSTYFSNIEGKRKNITLRQLLSHTAGFAVIGSPTVKQAQTYTLAQSAMASLRTKLTSAPGQEFQYMASGGHYQIAGYLAAKTSKTAWQQLYQDLLITPLNLGDTYFGGGDNVEDKTNISNPMIGGGLYISAADYLKILSLVYNNGQYNNAQLLKPETIQLMEQDQTSTTRNRKPNVGYNLGTWCLAHQDKQCTLMHSAGYYGTLPWLDRRNNLYGIFVVNNHIKRTSRHLQAARQMLTRLASTHQLTSSE